MVFSDSRQDASRAALDIERRHHQDSRRQMLLEALRAKADEPRESEADLKTRRDEADKRGDDAEFDRLNAKIRELRRLGDPDRIALASVVETAPAADQPPRREASPLLSRMIAIGMHPTDEVGIAKIPPTVTPDQSTSQFEWQNLRNVSTILRQRVS